MGLCATRMTLTLTLTLTLIASSFSLIPLPQIGKIRPPTAHGQPFSFYSNSPLSSFFLSYPPYQTGKRIRPPTIGHDSRASLGFLRKQRWSCPAVEEEDEREVVGEAKCVAVGLRLAVCSGWPNSLSICGRGMREKRRLPSGLD